MKRWVLCLASVVGLALAAVPARAVVVAGDTGTTDEAAPVLNDANGNNIGGNVGTVNGDSCIYIGNGWVLTADHVGAGSPVFPGVNGNQPFTSESGSGRQLTNQDGSGADMYLFRLTTDPALPTMTLSSTSAATLAANQTPVVMYGHGQSLTSGPNYYDTSTNPYTRTTTPTSEGGYTTTNSMGPGAGVFRAGTNFAADSLAAVDDHFGNTRTDSIITYFNPLRNANTQATAGDSGGAMFGRTASGGYELVGMMFAAGTNLNSTANQPASGTVVYYISQNQNPDADPDVLTGDGMTTGDSITASADISVYLSQIESITGVPEPATRWVGVLVGVAMLGSCRRWFFAK